MCSRRVPHIYQVAVIFLFYLMHVPVKAVDSLTFTEEDIRFLSRFSLFALPPPPVAPDNRYADNIDAAKWGQRIFFDAGFSANENVACASCHRPQQYFSDGLALGKGIGESKRNTISLLGAGYGPWKYWDGRKDSLWSQALEPLENPGEHGFSRARVYQRVSNEYAVLYTSIFGPMGEKNEANQTRVFVNVGKALMAYQRQLRLAPAKYDHYVAALMENKTPSKAHAFSESEVSGLRLFMGKAGCVSCHNGPLFSNFEFHNIGAPEPDKDNVDLGRYAGVEKLRHDEFNCLTNWSDAAVDQCDELNYLKKQGPELVGAFRTASLRNVGETAPYMHGGQLPTLKAVVQHYNEPTPPFYNREQHPNRPHFDIVPLGLNEQEMVDLVAFLKTLTSPIPEDDHWWQPPR